MRKDYSEWFKKRNWHYIKISTRWIKDAYCEEIKI